MTHNSAYYGQLELLSNTNGFCEPYRGAYKSFLDENNTEQEVKNVFKLWLKFKKTLK